LTIGRTPSQTVGPYYEIGLCRRPESELVPGGLQLEGRLYDGRGEPITDGMVEVWDSSARQWGRSGTDEEGCFRFSLEKPESSRGAPHLDVFVFARGLLRHQLTRVYFPDEEAANAADPVLAQLDDADRATLVAREEDGRLRFDIRMQGEGATVFFVH
jgi:protocatechuate 3,4-dioxygenase, alpha subunit